MKMQYITILILTLLFSISFQANATSQIPERIYVDGVRKSLLTIPIGQDSILEAAIIKLVGNEWQSTGCYRNYIGTWQIENGRLYLLQLSNIEEENIALPDVFLPYKEGSRYAATWFTGELRVGEGEVIYHSFENMGFSYYFAKETFYMVKNGLVIEEREYKNVFIPAERSFEETLKEISTQFDFTKFPELSTSSRLLLQFQFMPTPEGKINYFSRLQAFLYSEEGAILITDPENPYLKEVASLFHNVPQWQVFYLYGEIQPSPYYTFPIINQ